MFKHVWMEGYAGDDFYIASGNMALPDHGFETLIFGFRYLFAEVIGMPADKVKLKRVEISEAREGEEPYLFPLDMENSVFVYITDNENDGLFEVEEEGEEDSEDDETAV